MRSLIAGVLVGALVAAGFAFATAQAAPPPFTPGQALAGGQAMSLQDIYSSADLGINVAQANASYQDGTATASGALLESGFITLISELQSCNQYSYPPALVPKVTTVSTSSTNNARAVSASTSTGPAGAIGLAAKPDADGDARITGAGGGIPNLVTISGGVVHAESTSSPSTQTRTAVADVRDGDVVLLGGLVQLHGLHWRANVTVDGADSRADHRSSSPLFEIGSISVAGVTVPFSGNYQADLAAVDKLTGPLGVQLRLPTIQSRVDGGISTLNVGPLTVALGGATLTGSLLHALLGGTTLPQIENALKPGVFDPHTCNELGGLLKLVPSVNAQYNLLGAGYPIIVGAAVASLDGGGELDIDLGGAGASVDDTYYKVAGFGSPQFVTPPAVLGSGPSYQTSPAPPVSPGAAARLPGGSQTIVTTRTGAHCITTSPVGAPMCWSGHALAAGLLAAVVTIGLFAGDEVVRRRRTRVREAA